MKNKILIFFSKYLWQFFFFWNILLSSLFSYLYHLLSDINLLLLFSVSISSSLILTLVLQDEIEELQEEIKKFIKD